jgi:hypothetical protein
MKQLTKEEAIALFDSKAWEAWSPRDRATFQMAQDLLCMPFSVFHQAVEETLGRAVFTHEFGTSGRPGLIKELLGEAPPRTFEEIMALIPADTRVLVLGPPREVPRQ